MNRPLATLPMYDWPEVRPQTDTLWESLAAALRAAGFDAPGTLVRPSDPASAWRDPDLLVGQTCGFPLITGLKASVRVLATPHYAVPGCAGYLYSSAIIVRKGENAAELRQMKGRVAAINSRNSQSGMAALRHAFAPFAANGHVFSAVVETGGHRQSVRTVCEGSADIAAIDAVSWHLAERFDPDAAEGLKVLDWTPKMPGLPLITSAARKDDDAARLSRAVVAWFNDPASLEVRRPLAIAGATPTTLADYAVLEAANRSDKDAGYPVLA